uniref:proteasome endopeptidase complex n=1 Tax=Globodera rostochiensis TaxID=31243 RepID=A0A914IB81_GLORO
MYYRDLHDDETSYKAEIKRLVNMDDTAIPDKLELPPLGIKPKVFVNKYFGPNSRLPMAQFQKGTTTLAFVYKPKTPQDKGGVVVAVDSRASGGQFISSKTVMKIIPINDRMVTTLAGGAADCLYWTRHVSKYCNLFELRENTQISVAATSQYLANVLYGYRGRGLSVGSMVCGIDKSGPSVYLVQDTGARLKIDTICSVGSGMMNAMAIADSKYKEEMTDEEAIELGKEAIVHSTFRDGGSGGKCNVCHITSEGMTLFPPVDVSETYYQFMEKIGRSTVPEV